jgi:uncharacterized protein YkwD
MKISVIVLMLTVLTGFNTARKAENTPEICLSKEEKKLYDMIMAYRKSKGLKTIPLSLKLTQVAQAHARDLTDHYTFEGQDAKCNPHSWSDKGIWTGCCYTSDHREAACMWQKPKEIAGYTGDGFEIAYYSSADASAKEGLDGWKLSPGHNAMIINLNTWKTTEWNAIGIALYGHYGLVWFGEVEDNSPPLKVCP